MSVIFCISRLRLAQISGQGDAQIRSVLRSPSRENEQFLGPARFRQVSGTTRRLTWPNTKLSRRSFVRSTAWHVKEARNIQLSSIFVYPRYILAEHSCF